MKWTKYTITTTIESEDIVSAMLMELGVEGIEIENCLPPTDEEFEAMYIDIEPELMPDNEASVEDGVSLVSFYLREKGLEEAQAASEASESVDDSYTIHDKTWSKLEIAELLKTIENELSAMRAYTNLGEGTIKTEESHEENWRNNWKDFFKPQVMGNIIVKPTWAEIPEEYEGAVASGEIKVIEMDPGTAFGTGGHETTRLCVDGLTKYLKEGQTVLDIGTGSGILGFCALSMGAKFVMATELDPDCAHIIEENMELNDISSEAFDLAIGNIADDEAIIERAHSHGNYDIIVSNILAPVIATLASEGQADKFAHKGTIFVTSGIIDTREDEVVSAFEANPNWEVLETVRLGEWISVVAQKTSREIALPLN